MRGEPVYIARDRDERILGVYADRQDAADICELDWLASGAARGSYHWDENELINTAYNTAVCRVDTYVVE